MTAPADLPDYAPLLRAFHQGFAAELAAMVATLPIAPGDQILEVACGDGAYTPWLAGRAGPGGLVVGLDLSAGFLALARSEARESSRADPPAGDIRLVAASIERMPFAPASFDGVWCAQSLFSLPEPLDTVARMAALAKPGGWVAVLEDDTLHEVLLPWPVEVELAIRQAEWDALQTHVPHARKFYVGRRLVEVFHQAGLRSIEARTFATDRRAPLDPATRTYLLEYLKQIHASVAGRLGPEAHAELERWIDPDATDSPLDAPTLAVTVLNHVIQGRTPV